MQHLQSIQAQLYDTQVKIINYSRTIYLGHSTFEHQHFITNQPTVNVDCATSLGTYNNFFHDKIKTHYAALQHTSVLLSHSKQCNHYCKSYKHPLSKKSTGLYPNFKHNTFISTTVQHSQINFHILDDVNSLTN